MYGSTISFTYFEAFFLKIPMVKNFSPGEDYFPLQGGSIALIHTKNIYDLIVAILNKSFEFQND